MKKLLLVLMLSALFVHCREDRTAPQPATISPKTTTASVVPASATYDAFGIDVSNFSVQDFNVQKNESLYILLQKLNLSQSQIYRTIQKAKNIIDFNAFRPKQEYRAYRSPQNDKLKKLVWEPNRVEFVTFNWRQDSLQIYRASRLVTQKEKSIKGTINSSLYNAISDKSVRDKIVDKISDILAWRVNFFHIRKGDTFNILYNKKYVEGKFFDIGDILAIKLKNRGDSYFAYRFRSRDGNIDSYYDEKGKSVKRALLKTPFKYDQRISSPFNMHRFHPILHRKMPHTGIDYAAPYGTPVLAVGDGEVLEAHYGGAAGNIIKIRHNGTFETAYMHLSKFAHGIHRGAHVKQGEVIGYVGNTGRVTGTHLHYSMYKNNHAINPLKVDLPASKSIPKKYMADFQVVRKRLDKKLLAKKKVRVDSAAVNVSAVQ